MKQLDTERPCGRCGHTVWIDLTTGFGTMCVHCGAWEKPPVVVQQPPRTIEMPAQPWDLEY